jgi:hypothetical protein
MESDKGGIVFDGVFGYYGIVVSFGELVPLPLR